MALNDGELDEALARITVIMELLRVAGAEGRAAAIAAIEESIAFWEQRDGCEFVVREKQRAIEIIRNRSTATDEALTQLNLTQVK